MFRPLQSVLRPMFLKLEGWIDGLCGKDANPFYHLGALTFFFFWIVAATGLYLFIPYETSVAGVWQSIERISNEQWYFSGVMRSFHRYASDAMVLTTMIHLVREFAFDRFSGARWFAWFTGVPLLAFLFTSGITGYWLVWDVLAQYLSIGTMEWVDWFGIFGNSVARNFLFRGFLTDRFFTLLIFIHIFVPLFLLMVMFVHIMRIARPGVNPPKVLGWGSFIMLLGIAFLKPAVSHPQADLGLEPITLKLDWWYTFLYPLFDSWGPGKLWALVAVVGVVLSFMPMMQFKKRATAAEVQLDQCNGCTRCTVDCPFGAVTMVARTDGRNFAKQAKVDPDICTGCGICVGSCPTSTPFRSSATLPTGIDLPSLPLMALKNKTMEAMDRMNGGQGAVVVFGCEHGINPADLEGEGVASVRLPCTAMLPPPFIDFILSDGAADGVFLTGCRPGDCFHRLGPRWMEERLSGEREPSLRDRVPRERVRTCWAAPDQLDEVKADLFAFRARLVALDAARGQSEEASHV